MALARAEPAPAGDAPPIEKPQTDHREYLPVVLENGLRAVVISDSKCDKAAAALSVQVGSLFDPKEVQGLAHFCEHMLFLGTEKYPKEDEYNEYLAKHGGMSNAYTAETLTNYFFGVSPDHLEGALDRFCQFFITPLFTESATDRELKAVDSEHSKNQQSDAWRWQQMMKSDANPKHPLCHFGTGNSETLKTIPERDGCPVRQRLLEFHDKYYSANLMCVAVLGKESLEELVDLVRQKFGPVVNKKAKVPSGPDAGGGEPTFVFDGWPRLVRVIPVKDMRAATFQFVLPQQSPMRWRTKPHRYLSFLLGHEGKGSLLSCLKVQGIATELMAGPAMDEAGACVFEVTVHMTEQGATQVQRIGECLFAYVRLLQQCPVSDELFRETQCIEEMNFRFRSVGNPISTVSALAHAMQDDLPIDKVLSGPSKVWELDKGQVAEVCGYLTCKHMRLVLAMKTFTEEEHCPETERWYGTRYGAGPLPKEWHELWETRRTGGKDGGGEEAAVKAGEELGLALPLRNPFVAEDLDLKPKPEGGVPKYPYRVSPLPGTLLTALQSNSPAAVENSGKVLQVYFRQDDNFDLPKACLNVDLYCPWCSESLENRMATSLWAHTVTEDLNEYAYDAEVAGLYYGLSANSRGLNLRFSGYQDKLPVLLRRVAEKMVAMEEVSEHTWSIVHSVMLRNFTNAATTKQPYQQAAEWEQRCLMRTSKLSKELLDCFKTLTRDKLKGVSRRLTECCYAEALLQGNVDEVKGLGAIMEALVPTLRPKQAPPAVPTLGVAALPDGPGTCVLVRCVGTNPKEQNGAVVVTLQVAEESLEYVAMSELAAQVLGQRCFDELRTKQQLGYIVALQPYADGLACGFCGIKVVVQSEKHPAEVHRRIDAWLAKALEELCDPAALADAQLAEYHQALLTLKREKPKKLAEEFMRNWNQVSQRSFDFNRRDRTIEFLERPGQELLAEFRDFVRKQMIPAPRIAVEVLGAAAKATEGKPAPEGQPAPEVGAAATAEAPADAAAAANAASDIAEVAPYEGAVAVLESLEDVEEFRKRLTFRESNAKIVP